MTAEIAKARFVLAEPSHWGGLPAVVLHHPSGARATITLYGAHLVEWHSADGHSRVFCSRQSNRDGARAIRGGVPVIFPQFAERGDGMRHGFARVLNWQHLASGREDNGDNGDNAASFAEFGLDHRALPAAMATNWPHRFALTLRVVLGAQTLQLQLQVANQGATPFRFAAALHSYWQVADLAQVRISGLQGVPFFDQVSQAAVPASSPPLLAIEGKTDRIYHPIATTVGLHAAPDQMPLQLQQSGFGDLVLWNPGAQDAAAMADLADDEFQNFVCIEAAQVSPLELAAGQSWSGSQTAQAE